MKDRIIEKKIGRYLKYRSFKKLMGRSLSWKHEKKYNLRMD